MKLRGWFMLCLGVIGVAGLIFLFATFALSNSKKHDFIGKCQLCHTETPAPGTPYENMVFTTDKIDDLCSGCHAINKNTSHPTGVKPTAVIPLNKYLDREGKLTCVTCHDVHKEENSAFSKQELEDLLRGHTKGRLFCFVCHNEELLGVNWRHNLVVTYAHASGKLTQEDSGSLLDKHSVECLGCHDGAISKMGEAEIRSGTFKHGIGLSHPVGIEYPKASPKNDYTPMGSLPKEIQLFEGKMGCLSCHNPYGGKKNFLVMDNTRSRLCFACHKK